MSILIYVLTNNSDDHTNTAIYSWLCITSFIATRPFTKPISALSC